MNLTTAIFLVDDSVKAVKVAYSDSASDRTDPAGYTYKTLIQDLKKDDIVVIPSNTRVGYTTGKVVEIDVQPDFDSTIQYKWVVGRVNIAEYEDVLAREKTVTDQVAKASANKKKRELAEAIGMAEADMAAARALLLQKPESK